MHLGGFYFPQQSVKHTTPSFPGHSSHSDIHLMNYFNMEHCPFHKNRSSIWEKVLKHTNDFQTLTNPSVTSWFIWQWFILVHTGNQISQIRALILQVLMVPDLKVSLQYTVLLFPNIALNSSHILLLFFLSKSLSLLRFAVLRHWNCFPRTILPILLLIRSI